MFNFNFLFRNFNLIRRKSGISEIFKNLNEEQELLTSFGEDAGAIKLKGEYLLMSADGIMPELIKSDPEFAGICSVLVTVNDIQAMGGKPAGIVNVISADRRTAKSIVKGMKYAAKKTGVKILGGHYHPSNNSPHLSIASLGYARKISYSNTAERGNDILVVIDLNGSLRDSEVLALDAFSTKSKKSIQKILKIMPWLAEKGLLTSAKDISNAGILGTIAIILELSKKGGIVDSELIPWDSRMPLKKWLKVYPSYGFIITSKPANSPQIINAFKKQNIACNRVGVVLSGSELKVKWHGIYHTIADWKKKRIL